MDATLEVRVHFNIKDLYKKKRLKFCNHKKRNPPSLRREYLQIEPIAKRLYSVIVKSAFVSFTNRLST